MARIVDAACTEHSVPPLWKGSTSNSQQVYGATLSTGKYWVIYSASGAPNVIAGAVEGTATSINGVLYSTDALAFDIPSASVTPATVSVNYSSRHVIAGMVNFGQPASLTANYVNAPAADLSQVVGSYHGSAAIVGGGETVALTVGQAGAISGSGASGGSGVAGPRSDVPVFDISVTFRGAPCAMAGAVVSGIAFYDTTTGNLVAAAPYPRPNQRLPGAGRQVLEIHAPCAIESITFRSLVRPIPY